MFVWYLTGLSPEAMTRQAMADIPVELTDPIDVEAVTRRLRS